MKGRAFALLLAWTATAAGAEPAVNPLFSDHAVLQRDRPIPVWGMADPGERGHGKGGNLLQPVAGVVPPDGGPVALVSGVQQAA